MGLHMYCSQCGIKSLDNAKFCTECGNSLSTSLPKDTIEEQKDIFETSTDIPSAITDSTTPKKSYKWKSFCILCYKINTHLNLGASGQGKVTCKFCKIEYFMFTIIVVEDPEETGRIKIIEDNDERSSKSVWFLNPLGQEVLHVDSIKDSFDVIPLKYKNYIDSQVIGVNDNLVLICSVES